MNYLNWVALALTLSTRLPSAASSPMDMPASPDYEAMDIGSESQSDQPPTALSNNDPASEALAADLQLLPKHPAEEFQQGQRIQYGQLPTELKSRITDYAIVGNRDQLQLANKENYSLAKIHPYERALRRFEVADMARQASKSIPEISQLGQEAMPQLREHNRKYREAILLSLNGNPALLETTPVPQEYRQLQLETHRLAYYLGQYFLETTLLLQEVTKIWRRIFHHQFSASIFYYLEGGFMSSAYEIDQYATANNGEIDKDTLLDFYLFVKHNKDDPLFQLNAWDFINPDHLSSAALADQFPLLALVDVLSNGRQILEILRTLFDPTFLKAIDAGWEPTDSERMHRLIDFNVEPEEGPVAKERIFGAMIPRVISLVMARLATTGRFDHLMEFMDVLPALIETLNSTGENTRDPYFRDIYMHYSFNRLAVILAAVGHHKPALEQFTRVYTDGTSAIPPNDMLADQSELISIMRHEALPKGAEFLRQYWGLPPTSDPEDTSSTTIDGETHEDIPEVELPTDFTYTPTYLGGIYDLSDDNHMVVAMLRTENTSDEVAKLFKGDELAVSYLWNQLACQMTPEKFAQLRRLAYASTQVVDEMDVQISVTELLQYNGVIPSDF
ncbi:hypothetical protein H4R33_006882 [Dimargaris cristalligena]|nr:hypothetical protein H4R33_006882 [Dimargaris cristalligena]